MNSGCLCVDLPARQHAQDIFMVSDGCRFLSAAERYRPGSGYCQRLVLLTLHLAVLIVFPGPGVAVARDFSDMCWWEPQYEWIRPLLLSDGTAVQELILAGPGAGLVHELPEMYYAILPRPAAKGGRQLVDAVWKASPFFEDGQWKVLVRCGVPADIVLFSKVSIAGQAHYAQAFFSLWASAKAAGISSSDHLPHDWPVLLLWGEGKDRPFRVSSPLQFACWWPTGGGPQAVVLDLLHGQKTLVASGDGGGSSMQDVPMLSPAQESPPILFQFTPPIDPQLDNQGSRTFKIMIVSLESERQVARITCSFMLARDSRAHRRPYAGIAVAAGTAGCVLASILLWKYRSASASRRRFPEVR